MTTFIIASDSAGHIAPALELAAQHHARTGCHTHILTGSAPRNTAFITAHATVPHTTHRIGLGSVPYKKWWVWPWFICQLAYASTTALMLMLWHRPARLISTGGLLSIPVFVAARLYRCLLPLEWQVYELNAELGLAVKAVARLTGVVHSTWQQLAAEHPNIRFVPTAYPTRFTSSYVAPVVTEKTTLLVLGGSQGSQKLNTAMIRWVAQLSDADKMQLQIIHQTGKEVEKITAGYDKHQVAAEVFAYNPNLAARYNRADLVVCRAGAGTLAEVALFGKKAVLVPLRAATTAHQVANAHAFATMHDAQVCSEDELVDNLNRFIHGGRNLTAQELQHQRRHIA